MPFKDKTNQEIPICDILMVTKMFTVIHFTFWKRNKFQELDASVFYFYLLLFVVHCVSLVFLQNIPCI
jgi:hypothetical protein